MARNIMIAVTSPVVSPITVEGVDGGDIDELVAKISRHCVVILEQSVLLEVATDSMQLT